MTIVRDKSGGAGGSVGYDTEIYTSVQEVVRKIKTWKRENMKIECLL